MSDPTTEPTAGPYATAAATYWRAGWRGILPLPPRRKKSPPDGYAGRDGAWPSYPASHTDAFVGSPAHRRGRTVLATVNAASQWAL